jgi:hypothetical protein
MGMMMGCAILEGWKKFFNGGDFPGEMSNLFENEVLCNRFWFGNWVSAKGFCLYGVVSTKVVNKSLA